MTAAGTVKRIQAFYTGVKAVTSDFRQSVTNRTFGTEKTSDGKVWLAKPGKMRWDYFEILKDKTARVKKSFISNGDYLYVVENDNKQVIKKDLRGNLLPVAVSFLNGTGRLDSEFNASLSDELQIGEKTDVVVKLTPKKPSAQYKVLYLVVNPNDFHVSQSVIIDSSGNTNHFRFFLSDFETPVKETWFEFDPRSVPSYRVVDADDPKGGSADKAALP